MQQLGLGWTKSNVSVRASEQSVALGFLGLATAPAESASASASASTSQPAPASSSPSCSLIWAPKNALSPQDLSHFRESATRTRDARASKNPPPSLLVQAANSQSQHTPVAPNPKIIIINIKDISAVTFQPILTLTQGGDTACLVKLGIERDYVIDLGNSTERNKDVDHQSKIIQTSTASEDLILLDEFWFERDETNKDIPINLIIEEFQWWFASIGKCLVPEPYSPPAKGTESGDELEGPAPLVFTIQDKGEGSKDPSKDWPVTLPLSENGLVYRLGRFGLGVAAAVVGTSITNKVEDITRNAAWDVMEKFSRVTKFAQDTTLQVARPILPLLPTQLRNVILSSAEAEELINEYDSASQYLTQWAGELTSRITGSSKSSKSPPVVIVDKTKDFESLSVGKKCRRLNETLSAERWIMFYDDKGVLSISAKKARHLIYCANVDNDIRMEVWKFLLNVYPWGSTEKERVDLLVSKSQQYEIMKAQWRKILSDASANTLLAANNTNQSSPDADTFAGDEKVEGDVVSKMKERKYRVEKDVVRTDRTVPFFLGEATDQVSPPSPIPASLSLPSAGTTAVPNTPVTPVQFSPNLEMLKNVLITYTVYNFELGYVQGMNDLLAPILAIMRNEVDAFWCFAEFMERMKFNFFRDQSGMRKQLHLLELLIKFVDPPLYAHLDRIDSTNLFCCFRWILILFKREFEFNDIMRLWETIWACPFTKHFHLFIALSILNKSRQDILTKCSAFDEVLKLVNDLSCKIDLTDVLNRADVLFQVFQENITRQSREKLNIHFESDRDRTSSTSPIREQAIHSPETKESTVLANESHRGRDTTPAPTVRGLTPTTMIRSKSRSRSQSKTRAGNNVTEITNEALWELLELLEHE